MSQARCPDCGQVIYWGQDPDGRKTAIDTSPCDEGVWIWLTGKTVRRLSDDEVDDERFMNRKFRLHWSSCTSRRKKNLNPQQGALDVSAAGIATAEW